MNILAKVEDAASQNKLARFSILGRRYIVRLRACVRGRSQQREAVFCVLVLCAHGASGADCVAF